MVSPAIPTVAFQGAPGSFTHQAAISHFGPAFLEHSTTRFQDIFAAVKNGIAQFGVTPIENSLVGSIYENYDNLIESALMIAGEVRLAIEHCLVGLPGSTLADITSIASHPKALEQCSHFLQEKPGITIEAATDTASAARAVATANDLHRAAIASRYAADAYGLSILSSSIADHATNITRFWVISKRSSALSTDPSYKTSVELTIPHVAGSLLRILTILYQGGCSLTKIESRPIHDSPFQYRFFIDFTGWNDRLMEELSSHCSSIQILGRYPCKE